MYQNENSDGVAFSKWAVSVLIILCLVLSWTNRFDTKSREYIESSTEQAFIAFAGARALNAAISVAQSAQIGVSLGWAASLHPGEALDPVNDMVEDYSTAMKYAIGSLVSQRLIIEILSAQPIKWVLSILGIFLLLSIFMFRGKYSNFLYKGFLFIVLLRFLIIITVLLVGWLDSAFIMEETSDRMMNVKQDMGIVEEINREIHELSGRDSSENETKLVEYRARLQNKNEDIDRQNKIVSSREIKYKSLKDGYENKVGIISRLNPLNDDDEKESMQYQLGLAKESYQKAQNDKNRLNEQYEKLKDEIKKYEKRSNGEEGLIATVETKFHEMKNMIASTKVYLKSQELLEIFRMSIENMLHLVALFIFKTLILPISFIFIALYAFKFLWGYDLRKLISEKN